MNSLSLYWAHSLQKVKNNKIPNEQPAFGCQPDFGSHSHLLTNKLFSSIFFTSLTWAVCMNDEKGTFFMIFECILCSLVKIHNTYRLHRQLKQVPNLCLWTEDRTQFFFVFFQDSIWTDCKRSSMKLSCHLVIFYYLNFMSTISQWDMNSWLTINVDTKIWLG